MARISNHAQFRSRPIFAATRRSRRHIDRGQVTANIAGYRTSHPPDPSPYESLLARAPCFLGFHRRSRFAIARRPARMESRRPLSGDGRAGLCRAISPRRRGAARLSPRPIAASSRALLDAPTAAQSSPKRSAATRRSKSCSAASCPMPGSSIPATRPTRRGRNSMATRRKKSPPPRPIFCSSSSN